MNILITGAFGNEGIVTLKKLLDGGHKVRVLELKNKKTQKILDSLQKEEDQKIDILWGDITDYNVVKRAINGQDIIIHQAFIIPALSEQKPNWAWERNGEGTRKLLKSAGEADRKIKRREINRSFKTDRCRCWINEYSYRGNSWKFRAFI